MGVGTAGRCRELAGKFTRKRPSFVSVPSAPIIVGIELPVLMSDNIDRCVVDQSNAELCV